MQTLRQLGLSVDAFAWYIITVQLVVLLGYGAVGAVLFWRASADRVALLTSLTLILYTINFYGINLYGLPSGSLPRWTVPSTEGLALLGAVCIGAFFCVFPSGRFVPRWTPWLLLAWAAYRAYDAFFWYVPHAPFVRTPPDFAVSVFLEIGMVAAQVSRYRRVSTPVQRQQTKWAVLGAALALGGYLAAFLVFVILSPSVIPLSPLADDVGYAAGTLLTLPLPLGLGIAILRNRLFDIDVIIRRTLVYGTLTASLAAIYFALVFAAQMLGDRLTGQAAPPPWLIVITTLLIAALFTPLRRTIQRVIDRRFFRSRYNATHTIEAFAATLRTELDLSELSEHLVGVVQDTVQPATVSLWLRVPHPHRADVVPKDARP
jgi:hypothetical protein